MSTLAVARFLVVLTLLAPVLSACGPASTTVPATPEPGFPAIPNPAAQFCIEQGGRSEIRTADDGSQTGYCRFPDGSECDEWAYYRGECASGRQTPATPVIPSPEAYEGWFSYINEDYNFSFRYPADWTLELDTNTDSTSYLHALRLRPAGDPQRVLTIAFKGIREDVGIGRTGVGAGDIVRRGAVFFLGSELPRDVLVAEGKDMAILYGGGSVIERGGLAFALCLDYIGSPLDEAALSPEIELQADLVVASFEVR